jgi:hypothetical protein
MTSAHQVELVEQHAVHLPNYVLLIHLLRLLLVRWDR